MIGLTGPNAALGIDGRDAVLLYLDQHDYKVGDYKIDLVVEDDEATATTALTKARKLVDMDKVDLLMGPHAAAGAYALLPYVEEVKVPLYIPGASGDDVTQRKRSQYAVRSGTSSSQPMHPLGEYVAVDMGCKRAAILSYDNAYGYEVAGGFHDSFEQNGGQVVQKIFVPAGTNDFSPYITQLPLDEVDVFFFNISGADAVRLTKQLKEYGVTDKVKVVAGCTPTDESTLDQLDPSCIGFISANNYSAALDTPANKAFAEAFQAAYGRSSSFVAEQYYAGMMFLAEALANAEDPYDPLSLLDTIRNTKVEDAPRGPISIDEYGNAVHNIYIREVQEVDGKRQNTVVKTYENVSQFYKADPEEYLSKPIYDATNPPVGK